MNLHNILDLSGRRRAVRFEDDAFRYPVLQLGRDDHARRCTVPQTVRTAVGKWPEVNREYNVKARHVLLTIEMKPLRFFC